MAGLFHASAPTPTPARTAVAEGSAEEDRGLRSSPQPHPTAQPPPAASSPPAAWTPPLSTASAAGSAKGSGAAVRCPKKKGHSKWAAARVWRDVDSRPIRLLIFSWNVGNTQPNSDEIDEWLPEGGEREREREREK